MQEIRQEEIKFMPHINKIVAENFHLLPTEIKNIHLSDPDEDTQESFDMIYESRVEISVRIRKNQYLKYGDFTIRSKSKWGYETEIHKITKGKGSIYLYAWKDFLEQHLQSWILVDINQIRNDLTTNGTLRDNRDGTMFKAYSLAWLHERNAIIQYHELPRLKAISLQYKTQF